MALTSIATMHSQTTNTPRRPRRMAAVIAAKIGISIAIANERDMLEVTLQSPWLIAGSSHGSIYRSLPSELGIFMIVDSILHRRYTAILSTDAYGVPFLSS